jgi:hypothetical protein
MAGIIPARLHLSELSESQNIRSAKNWRNMFLSSRILYNEYVLRRLLD